VGRRRVKAFIASPERRIAIQIKKDKTKRRHTCHLARSTTSAQKKRRMITITCSEASALGRDLHEEKRFTAVRVFAGLPRIKPSAPPNGGRLLDDTQKEIGKEGRGL